VLKVEAVADVAPTVQLLLLLYLPKFTTLYQRIDLHYDSDASSCTQREAKRGAANAGSMFSGKVTSVCSFRGPKTIVLVRVAFRYEPCLTQTALILGRSAEEQRAASVASAITALCCQNRL
jgi:hypothetical protein